MYIWSYLFTDFELKFSARQLALQVRLSQGLDHIEQESGSQGLMICIYICISLFITVCIQRCAVTCWLMRIERFGPIGQPGNVQRWVGLGPQCSCDGVFSNLRSASWRNHIRKSEKSLHHFFCLFSLDNMDMWILAILDAAGIWGTETRSQLWPRDRNAMIKGGRKWNLAHWHINTYQHISIHINTCHVWVAVSYQMDWDGWYWRMSCLIQRYSASMSCRLSQGTDEYLFYWTSSDVNSKHGMKMSQAQRCFACRWCYELEILGKRGWGWCMRRSPMNSMGNKNKAPHQDV